MSKRTPPNYGARFDALLQNIAAATGNDAEIEALHDVARNLWQLLTPEQQVGFFTRSEAIETKASRWAGAPTPTRPRKGNRTAALASACESLLEAFLESGDLNDLPASQVIQMLQQALRRRDLPPARNIAANAARIGNAFDWLLDFTPVRVEETVAAATALHEIESREHFDWADQPVDWETVCASIARRVAKGRSTNWSRFIRSLLTPKGRKRKEAQ